MDCTPHFQFLLLTKVPRSDSNNYEHSFPFVTYLICLWGECTVICAETAGSSAISCSCPCYCRNLLWRDGDGNNKHELAIINNKSIAHLRTLILINCPGGGGAVSGPLTQFHFLPLSIRFERAEHALDAFILFASSRQTDTTPCSTSGHLSSVSTTNMNAWIDK